MSIPLTSIFIALAGRNDKLRQKCDTLNMHSNIFDALWIYDRSDISQGARLIWIVLVNIINSYQNKRNNMKCITISNRSFDVRFYNLNCNRRMYNVHLMTSQKYRVFVAAGRVGSLEHIVLDYIHYVHSITCTHIHSVTHFFSFCSRPLHTHTHRIQFYSGL